MASVTVFIPCSVTATTWRTLDPWPVMTSVARRERLCLGVTLGRGTGSMEATVT